MICELERLSSGYIRTLFFYILKTFPYISLENVNKSGSVGKLLRPFDLLHVADLEINELLRVLLYPFPIITSTGKESERFTYIQQSGIEKYLTFSAPRPEASH